MILLTIAACWIFILGLVSALCAAARRGDSVAGPRDAAPGRAEAAAFHARDAREPRLERSRLAA